MKDTLVKRNVLYLWPFRIRGESLPFSQGRTFTPNSERPEEILELVGLVLTFI